MVVIDLERLFALPQHAGDLSVGHPVVVAEVEDQPLLERQLQDRLLEKSPGLRCRSIVSAVFVAMR